MRIDVIPLVGFNQVRFGQSRSEVRNILGQPENSRRRNESDPSPYDYFKWNFFCYYSNQDLIDSVEFGELSNVHLYNLEIFASTSEQIIDLLEARGHRISRRVRAFEAKEIGIAFTTRPSDRFHEIEIIESFLSESAPLQAD